jgi:RNA polymerase sigma-70 factor (ECF subfamily)
MYAIASHVMSRQMRRHRRRALRERPVEPSMHVAVPDDSYARLDFARAFGRLTPPQRQALELLKIEGFSTEAAAARAGVSPVAFRVRAHRAYKALRRLLGS